MLASHAVILKAKPGELNALRNLDDHTGRKVLPLFEIGRITADILERKYMQSSSTPTITYLNRVLDKVGDAWPNGTAMVDGYHWSPSAHAENGEHVIAYFVARLRAMGMSVIPVVGYDRWTNPEYRLGLQTIPAHGDGHYCLRLDSAATEDAAEPEHFQGTIHEIVDELELDPARCSILLDFADISSGAASIEELVATASNIIQQLQIFGFRQYILAGCSLPRTIDLAVTSHDAERLIPRKELLVWQALRLSFPDVPLMNGDYGVRGPTTTEIRSNYTNGKIRHTVKKQTFVVRGHPFSDDHSFAQMYDLAAAIVNSPHFLGEDFSWGDAQITRCSQKLFLGNLSDWIAVDTNHHLTFAVQEAEEYERDLVARAKPKAYASLSNPK